ncbi:MAG: hypothetical protein EBS18_02485 [Actinobacteria bacterium]|nr:hypothetical protein [Actinomycetota bacterium]
MAKDIAYVKANKGQEADYRQLGPLRVCPCGSEVWNVKCKFDDEGKIGIYFLDMRCLLCDSLAVAPYEGQL